MGRPADAPESKPKGRIRRVLVWVRRIAVGLVLLVLTLLGSALIALRFPATRAMLRTPVAGLVSGAIPGSIEIGGIDALSLRSVVLRDVRVRDPSGRTVLTARRLSARPRVVSLFDKLVRLEDVRARGVDAELRPTRSGGLGLVDAFVEETPAPAPPSDSSSSWEVDVQGIAIDEGVVRLAVGAEPYVELREVAIRGGVRVTESTLVRIDRISARGFRGDTMLLESHDLLGALRTGPNEASNARGTLSGDGDRLRLDARIANGAGEDAFAEGAVDARLTIASLTTRLLAPFDLADLEADAPREIHGSLRVSGSIANARVAGELFVDGRRVALDGALAMAETSRLELCLDETPLAAFWKSLPDTRLGGCFVAEVGSLAEADLPVSLAIREASVDGAALPDAVLRATVHFETRRVDVESFVLAGFADTTPPPITIDGWADFDGRVELQVVLRSFGLETDPAIRKLTGGLRGTLDGQVRFAIGTGATETAPSPLRGSVHLAMNGLRTSGVRARRIEIASEIGGTTETPSLRAAVTANALDASGVHLERLEANAQGTLAAARLAVDGTFRRDRAVHLVATTRSAGSMLHAALEGTVGRTRSPWQVKLARGSYDTRRGAIRVEGFALSQRDASVTLDGSLSGGGAIDARLAIHDLDPKTVFEALAIADPGIHGKLALEATVGGTTRVPTAHVEGSFEDGEVLGARDLTLVLLTDLEESGLHVELDLDADDRGSIAIAGDARWPDRTPIARAFEVAELELRAKTDALEIGKIDRELPTPVGIGGTVDAEITVTGTATAPQLNATLAVENASSIALPLSRAIDLEAQAVWGSDGLDARLAIEDDEGELVRMDARAALPAAEAIAAFPDPNAIDWSVYVLAPERAIASLPLGVATTSGLPLLASVDLMAEHRVGSPVSARMNARLRGEPSDSDEEEDDDGREPPCASVETLAIAIRGALDRGRLGVDVDVAVADRPASSIHVDAELPVDAWLAGDSGAKPSGLALEGTVDGLDVSALPYACEYASGPITARVSGTALESPDSRLALELHAPAIRFADEGSVALDAEASLTRSNATADLVIAAPDGSRSTVRAALPLSMDTGIAEGPMTVDARFHELSLEPFTAFTPFVPRRAGTIDGWITIAGTTSNPTPHGELRLKDATLVMPGLEQRLSDTNVHVSLSPTRIVVHEFRARDVRGRVAIDGEVAFAGQTPTAMHFDVRSSSFPVRQSGIAIASVDSRARLDLVRESAALRGEVKFDDLLVRMPDESPGSVQALEENPDIVYVDTPPAGWEPNTSVVPAASAVENVPTSTDASDTQVHEEESVASAVDDDSPFVPTYVRLDLRRPFWIRRTDFAVQLTADLRISVEERGVKLAGTVEAVRGTLDLLGTTFEIREGTIRFSGGNTIDPSFDITALANTGEENQVRVHVIGTLEELKLEFFDAADRELTAGLAVQCITTGDCTEFGEIGSDGDAATATQQARSALASMTVGLLTTAARHGIGDAVPRIAVSTGDRLEEVTVRAGFDANRLVPRFLRGIVSNLYIEGFVSNEAEQQTETSSSSQSTATRASGGFLIELRHPHRVVTRAQYEPPTTWSMDITWHP